MVGVGVGREGLGGKDIQWNGFVIVVCISFYFCMDSPMSIFVLHVLGPHNGKNNVMLFVLLYRIRSHRGLIKP